MKAQPPTKFKCPRCGDYVMRWQHILVCRGPLGRKR